MSKSAYLAIVYDANNNPISARCSLCGKKMPSANQNVPKGNLIDWFAAFFDLHCKDEHLSPKSD
jgi:hypothetical protein